LIEKERAADREGKKSQEGGRKKGKEYTRVELTLADNNKNH